MNIESLKLFQQVVEAKSISKVAQHAHISQSALSQMIGRIEDELGHRLLIRSNSGVVPTEMGEVVLKYSENISLNYQKMLEEMVRLEKKLDTVRINASWSLVNYSLPCTLYRVKKKFSTHKYELISSSNDKTIRDITNDICDIGFVSCEINDKKLNVHRIGLEKVVLVASYNSEIPESIALEDLKKYEFVTLRNIDSINSCLNRELIQAGLAFDDLKIIFDVDSISAVKASIENNYGVSFLPYTAVKRELYEKRYRIVEVDGLNMDYSIYMVSKLLNKVSASVKESVEAFIEIGKEGFC
ncbi:MULTISPECIES: LysR family transcriptional regulator [unclassified Fusibacter]|uniref:LysR family transcriptional regulator n=1 Tax=unclassified Fusibacter TaxID=2624464 RepID=UPI001010CD33|nr:MULTISPECIES: LysR family transcriptional regulator [unclassified Fusibacter]MCK8058180.1 LysR family transcriptional regulator [Fusibacter sp. A2]NPE20763.1 LysR family transcriptional regulator [Fusibacter sp. A1]RXV62970.1 LysR family transcriptional regulator [Fusibacter sp. A1]